jgi:ferredoxin
MADKKLVIDKLTCQGFRQCEALAPELFRINDQRFAVVIKHPENEGELAAAKAAVKACPRHAIRLKDAS